MLEELKQRILAGDYDSPDNGKAYLEIDIDNIINKLEVASKKRRKWLEQLGEHNNYLGMFVEEVDANPEAYVDAPVEQKVFDTIETIQGVIYDLMNMEDNL